MSIARLALIAAQKLPLNVSDEHEIDELRVLMAAGLIAGLHLRSGAEPGLPARRSVLVLAITPDGLRLLRRVSANASLFASTEF